MADTSDDDSESKTKGNAVDKQVDEDEAKREDSDEGGININTLIGRKRKTMEKPEKRAKAKVKHQDKVAGDGMGGVMRSNTI